MDRIDQWRESDSVVWTVECMLNAAVFLRLASLFPTINGDLPHGHIVVLIFWNDSLTSYRESYLFKIWMLTTG